METPPRRRSGGQAARPNPWIKPLCASTSSALGYSAARVTLAITIRVALPDWLCCSAGWRRNISDYITK
jgi:hypothetical protein